MYLIYCVLLLFSPSNMSSTARACSLWFTSICLISRANPLPDPQFPSVGHTCPCKAQPQRACLRRPGQGYCSPGARQSLAQRNAEVCPLKTLQEEVDPIPQAPPWTGGPTENHCPCSSPVPSGEGYLSPPSRGVWVQFCHPCWSTPDQQTY